MSRGLNVLKLFRRRWWRIRLAVRSKYLSSIMVMSTPMILLRSIPIRGNCSWWSRFAIHSKVTATTILFFRKLLLCTLMGQPIMFSTDLAVGKTLPEGRGLPIKIRLSTMKDHFPKETCPW